MKADQPVSFAHSLQPTVFHCTWFAMNTRFSMVLVGIESDRAESLATAAKCQLRAYERLMSRFDAQGPLSDLNRQAAEIAMEPPQALWEILVECRKFWKQTDGAFDIALWPLNRLWREYVDRDGDPAAGDLLLARQQAGMGSVEFDDGCRTVRFEEQGMSLDLGGFGKGFALEGLAASLRKEGVERALLSFGESSITVLGSHPHGPSWPVGITNIFGPSQTLHTFHLRDASLSTSGTAPFNRTGGPRRFSQIMGQIIDPRKGRPIEGYRTMSVVGSSGTEAEVLSTALLVTPQQNRAKVLSQFSAVSALEIAYSSYQGGFVPEIEWQYGI